MASCSIEKTSDSSGPQKNATACGVNVEETEEGNINVKKRRVEWKLLTPSTWNLPDIIDTLKKRSARLRQWFEIENVFEGSLVIQTLVQQNVLDNREEFRASVHLFLEKFVEVCRINADVPTVIEVALIIELGEFEKEETEEQPSNIEMKKKDETIHCQKCRQKDEIIDSLISLKEELYVTQDRGDGIRANKVATVTQNIGAEVATGGQWYDAVILHASEDEMAARLCQELLQEQVNVPNLKIALPDDIITPGIPTLDGLAGLLLNCRLVIIYHSRHMSMDDLMLFEKQANIIQSEDPQKRDRIIPFIVDCEELSVDMCTFQPVNYTNDISSANFPNFKKKMERLFLMWRDKIA